MRLHTAQLSLDCLTGTGLRWCWITENIRLSKIYFPKLLDQDNLQKKFLYSSVESRFCLFQGLKIYIYYKAVFLKTRFVKYRLNVASIHYIGVNYKLNVKNTCSLCLALAGYNREKLSGIRL